MNVLKKILFVINVCFLMLLNNCVQSTATLFGPAFTAAKTGSVYQAGLSYGSNSFLKKQLGKDPAVYVKDLFAQNFNQNKEPPKLGGFENKKIFEKSIYEICKEDPIEVKFEEICDKLDKK